MDIRDVFARNLREAPARGKAFPEGLAHRAEIDRTYISALERSVYAASIDVVDRLATVLGAQASDLLVRPSTSRDKESQRGSRRAVGLPGSAATAKSENPGPAKTPKACDTNFQRDLQAVSRISAENPPLRVCRSRRDANGAASRD
jgi:hypothetical protein